ncbi:MAG TPA: hypothetical protein VFS13_01840 [Steroidobacteraceae bacterium]|nr:hypothetical protein [Steroidobacteraceae bacterium]
MSLARFRNLRARTHRLTSSVLSTAVASAMALTLGATTAQARPVIPGAAGYGIETTAGRGGKVYKVTNLKADGAGSLKACIDASGPRVCVFEVSGVIKLTSDLKVRNSNITIAGQTAPAPGIMIRGAALDITTSDVLVQHLRVRAGDDPVGPDPQNRDSLKIEGTSSKPVKNIVIDHCTFEWAIDETASVWGPHDNITFSNNIFAEALNESLHKDDATQTTRIPHGYGVLLGSSASGGRVTMIGNLLAHMVERNPLVRSRELVFVNNLVYNRGTMDYDGQTEYDRVTKSSLVGNAFLRGPDYSRTTRPIYLRTKGSASLVYGARVYVNDNWAPESGSSLDDVVSLNGGDVISGLLTTSTRPVWNSGINVIKNAHSAVYSSVLANAGARPVNRDRTDRRIVYSVRVRGGQIINCVAPNGTTRCKKNAGGWPSYTQNTRRLTIPSNPSTVASNGYTNLENWLHALDDGMNGVSSSLSPTAPASLSVK